MFCLPLLLALVFSSSTLLLLSCNSAVSQSIAEESVTCIAVKEDRQQNTMCSVVLKKGVEEPWAIGRVALGYRETTLKSDTEPAIIAFTNRVAEDCKAEVASEDAVKGDKQTHGIIENELRGLIRTIKCHIERSTQEPVRDGSPVLLSWTQAASYPDVGKVATDGHHMSDCMERDHIKNSFHGARKCLQHRYQLIQLTDPAVARPRQGSSTALAGHVWCTCLRQSPMMSPPKSLPDGVHLGRHQMNEERITLPRIHLQKRRGSPKRMAQLLWRCEYRMAPRAMACTASKYTRASATRLHRVRCLHEVHNRKLSDGRLSFRCARPLSEG